MSRYSPFLKWGVLAIAAILVGLLALLVAKRPPQETIQQSLLGAAETVVGHQFDDKLGSLIDLVPEVGGREPTPQYVSAVDNSPQFADNFRDKAWLISQGESAFTLQVMAASNMSSVNQFFANQPDPTIFTYFETTQDGHSWYVITYGVFSSREQALGALNVLSLDAESRPFPKRIGSYLVSDPKPASLEPAPKASVSVPESELAAPQSALGNSSNEEDILPEF